MSEGSHLLNRGCSGVGWLHRNLDRRGALALEPLSFLRIAGISSHLHRLIEILRDVELPLLNVIHHLKDSLAPLLSFIQIAEFPVATIQYGRASDREYQAHAFGQRVDPLRNKDVEILHRDVGRHQILVALDFRGNAEVGLAHNDRDAIWKLLVELFHLFRCHIHGLLFG